MVKWSTFLLVPLRRKGIFSHKEYCNLVAAYRRPFLFISFSPSFCFRYFNQELLVIGGWLSIMIMVGPVLLSLNKAWMRVPGPSYRWLSLECRWLRFFVFFYLNALIAIPGKQKFSINIILNKLYDFCLWISGFCKHFNWLEFLFLEKYITSFFQLYDYIHRGDDKNEFWRNNKFNM